MSEQRVELTEQQKKIVDVLLPEGIEGCIDREDVYRACAAVLAASQQGMVRVSDVFDGAAFDLLKRLVDKLHVIIPIVDEFIQLQAIRSGNMNIYDGPSIEQELKEADALLQSRRTEQGKEAK